MPLSSVASYLSTTEAFIAHWTAVNADLGAALVLPTTYNVASLTTDRATLQTKITAIQTADNSVEIAAGARDLKKGPLRERVRQFRTAMQSYFKGTEYLNALPTIPRMTANEGDFTGPFDDMLNLWTRINAITPVPVGMPIPLLLVAGYTLANFTADLAALRAAYSAWQDAVQGAQIARDQRNLVMANIRSRLVQYRLAAQSKYAAGAPLLESLPAVYPPAGSTPDPVVLSGMYSATDETAHMSWTASTNPRLKHYAVRACDPPRYRAVDETAVQLVPAGTTTLVTNFGLTVPGAVKLFKVYVVTEDDNEKGSNSVKVTRP